MPRQRGQPAKTGADESQSIVPAAAGGASVTGVSMRLIFDLAQRGGEGSCQPLSHPLDGRRSHLVVRPTTRHGGPLIHCRIRARCFETCALDYSCTHGSGACCQWRAMYAAVASENTTVNVSGPKVLKSTHCSVV